MVERSVRYRTKPKKSLISGSQHGNESQSKGSGPEGDDMEQLTREGDTAPSCWSSGRSLSDTGFG